MNISNVSTAASYQPDVKSTAKPAAASSAAASSAYNVPASAGKDRDGDNDGSSLNALA